LGAFAGDSTPGKDRFSHVAENVAKRNASVSADTFGKSSFQLEPKAKHAVSAAESYVYR